MPKDTKPYLNINQQIKLLKNRGLKITDIEKARYCLHHIGYHRLSGYFILFRQLDTITNKIGNFIHGSEFKDAVDLYIFDKKLRILILDGIERIEVSVRVNIADLLGEIDPFAYENINLLQPKFVENHFQKWTETHNANLKKSHSFAKNGKAKYNPKLPIWEVIEVWDFGMMSKFYNGIKLNHRVNIARIYAIPKTIDMASWLQTLNFLRNMSAHHSRLWNQNIGTRPQLPKGDEFPKFNPPKGDDNRIYYGLCIMVYLIREISPNSTWPARLKNLLLDFPNFPKITGQSVKEMGFFDGWENQPFWQMNQS